MTWYEARTYCRSNYTDLVSVRDSDENEQIESLVTKHEPWLGLHRKTWAYWSDKTPNTFTNWNENYPQNTDDKKSCVKVDTTTGMWSNDKCKEKKKFICQKVYSHQQQTFKLKFQSKADLKDPAIQQQLLEQLHAKLEKHGLSDFKLRWTQKDGQTFHKEQKMKKEKEPVW
ncbi:P-selectin [Liparis tanakae]|uniref:p-selectin n=1 Tax=Liparis tanakae TaxID=230148 RepID=A0A4Z2GJF5_9TELE|nr:P-selectin [Liparis tanakae]